ncbi:hypothetical protein [Actinospica robiniae]|uniref:hypothetical protein n=1 Tax=Actinospica robiniae TaxID=304901 RepID=UPI000401D695|nr:hypothetical protein [Actinospica robiniae]
MTAADASSAPPFNAMLSRLYFIRFAFALVWAVALFPSSKHTGGPLSVLLVIYPLVDAAAVLWQLRAQGRTPGSGAAERINVVVSVLVAIALGWASSVSIADALAVWGVWAAASGITQLVTAVLRRSSGGQVPQILSGGISTLAGVSFLLQASKSPHDMSAVGGYAILGGIFFLISGLRLRSLVQRAAA